MVANGRSKEKAVATMDGNPEAVVHLEFKR